jgi:hypothetical protein
VKDDFEKWEIQVMGALTKNIEQLKEDAEDDSQDVSRQLEISSDINRSLSSISRRLVREAQLESIQQKKVSINEKSIHLITLYKILILRNCLIHDHFFITERGRCFSIATQKHRG